MYKWFPESDINSNGTMRVSVESPPTHVRTVEKLRSQSIVLWPSFINSSYTTSSHTFMSHDVLRCSDDDG